MHHLRLIFLHLKLQNRKSFFLKNETKDWLSRFCIDAKIIEIQKRPLEVFYKKICS